MAPRVSNTANRTPVRAPHSRLVRTMLACAIMATVVAGGGFVYYLSLIHGGYYTNQAPKSDAIAVLTGGYARLEPAADLLLEGRGQRLLVSGVNEVTRGPALAAALGVDADNALFQCCVDIDVEARNTVGNAREIVDWAQQNQFQSVIIVTNDYHMPRSLSELRRIAPNLRFEAYAVSNPPQADEAFQVKMNRYRVLAIEYAKFVFSSARRLGGL